VRRFKLAKRTPLAGALFNVLLLDFEGEMCRIGWTPKRLRYQLICSPLEQRSRMLMKRPSNMLLSVCGLPKPFWSSLEFVMSKNNNRLRPKAKGSIPSLSLTKSTFSMTRLDQAVSWKVLRPFSHFSQVHEWRDGSPVQGCL
jgi:hypothetical protein